MTLKKRYNINQHLRPNLDLIELAKQMDAILIEDDLDTFPSFLHSLGISHLQFTTS
jgi:hypothetical protein